MNKIELISWDHECGDGCCYDYGLELKLNGERLTMYADHNLQETLEKLLAKLNVPAEIVFRQSE